VLFRWYAQLLGADRRRAGQGRLKHDGALGTPSEYYGWSEPVWHIILILPYFREFLVSIVTLKRRAVMEFGVRRHTLPRGSFGWSNIIPCYA
jgi:hypothetical protein